MTGQSTAPEVPCGSSQVRHTQRGRPRQVGSMGNVVVNTIVRMFTRKAARKAMKSAKKSMGAKKGKQDGGHMERPNKRGAENKKVID
jgi:alpha/beta superfamily hydrolase